MKRLPSNSIVICMLLGLLLLLAIGLLFIPIRSVNALQISFLSYTNDVKSGKLAVFAATNFSDESISFAPCDPQTNNFGHWAPILKDLGNVKTLSGQTTTNFTIAITTNLGVWRQPVFWTHDQSSKLEDIQSKLKLNLYFNWRLISQGNRPRYFNISNGNGHMAFSSVITNK